MSMEAFDARSQRKDSPAVDAFQSAFHRFREAKAKRLEGWRSLFSAFGIAFKAARKDRAAETPRLNTLDVFGLKTRELCHSRVVEWFLKEDESHEQGSLFMECLLAECGFPYFGCTGYIVKREKPDRVDVAAHKRGAFAVFIENKVEHHERLKQVADLQESLVRFSAPLNIPESHRIAVFLTDDGRRPTTAHEQPLSGFLAGNLRPISRLTLFLAFKEALAARTIKSLRLTSFLEDYVVAISTHRGSRL